MEVLPFGKPCGGNEAGLQDGNTSIGALRTTLLNPLSPPKPE
jgi:hypothetical protein